MAKNLPFVASLLSILFFTTTHAATFDIVNQCSYTVWAASTPIGGGRRLNPGESWQIEAPPGTAMARIWGRTNCNDDGTNCETGDCGALECQGWGKPPNTLAEYALQQYAGLDYPDISLVDGFNIPMEFSPSATTDSCPVISCTAPINDQCPNELRVPGGCNNPCTVYQTNQYCCTDRSQPCNPTDFSMFFKDRCPDTYTYPADDATGQKACPSGTNYRVVFCP